VEISGVDQLPYNGIFQITVSDPTHFTSPWPLSPGVNATGTTNWLVNRSGRSAPLY